MSTDKEITTHSAAPLMARPALTTSYSIGKQNRFLVEGDTHFRPHQLDSLHDDKPRRLLGSGPESVLQQLAMGGMKPPLYA